MLEEADAFQEKAVLRTASAFVPKFLQKFLKFSQEGCWDGKIQGNIPKRVVSSVHRQ